LQVTAHVIERFDHGDVEAALAGHREGFARAIRLPFVAVFEADAAWACLHFHQIGSVGAEVQRAGQASKPCLNRIPFLVEQIPCNARAQHEHNARQHRARRRRFAACMLAIAWRPHRQQWLDE
jgi:hypothetical protein